MGIIKQQAVKGTVYSYIGVVIGFITTAVIFPRILSTEEIGLLKLLVSFSVLFAQFGSLGFTNVINRLFPYFRDKNSGHSGFVIIALIVSFTGFIISIAGLLILKPVFIRNNIENSALFVSYFNYLVPLIFFTLFFGLFDAYIKALYDAVVGTAMKELVQRILILISVVLYFFNYISFKNFVLFYVISLSVPTVIIFIILIINGDFLFRKPGPVFNKVIWKEMASLCFHGLLVGFGSIAVLQLDSIMVNRFMGISPTGIYATTFFFATIILIPSRPLLKISTTIIADAWKVKDINTIKTIYEKGSLTQAIAALFLFIVLWVNINNVFIIIPKEYEAGKWVIFFVGIKNVIEMATTMSSTIIQTSSYYRINTLIISFFLALMILFMLILIPLYNITGAAISILIAYTITAFLQYLFLKVKYKIVPFDYKILVVTFIALISYVCGYFIPLQNSFLIDIFIRTTVSGGIFFITIVFLKISEDINQLLNQLFKTKIFWKEE